MSVIVIFWGIILAQVLLSVALLFALYRLLVGPRAQDRVVGLDALYVTTMMLFLTFDMQASTSIYFEAALVIGLLGFVSNVALAKFLMRGEVIE